MGDLIDRDDAIKAVKMGALSAATLYGRTDEGSTALYETVRAIKAIPSAQPERKKGRWIYGEHDIAMCDGYRCDKCGFFVPWDYKFKFIDFINDYHFCPNCGSDMRGEDDETD